jgi:hypothetical protein
MKLPEFLNRKPASFVEQVREAETIILNRNLLRVEERLLLFIGQLEKSIELETERFETFLRETRDQIADMERAREAATVALNILAINHQELVESIVQELEL